MPAILLVFLAVGWTITGILSVFRIRSLREFNDILADGQAEAQEFKIEAERRTVAAETENQYLKATLAQVLQRPAIAAFTDENIQQLVALIQSLIKPNTMN